MKNYELRFLTNPPLSRICQSATTKQYQGAPHFHEAARRLTRALFVIEFLLFSLKTMVYCIVSFTPSAEAQRSSVHINNIETQTAINDIIAPDEYQTLLWHAQLVCLGFLLE